MTASRQTHAKAGAKAGPPRGGARLQDVGAAAAHAFAGAGAALPAARRAELEPRFGWDFGRVRIHAGPEAAAAADRLGARAFTFGPNIAFARDAYAPGTEAGRRLLAHELAHVVQDGAASRDASPADAQGLSEPADPAEIAAERAARAVTAPADLSALPMPALGRRSGPPVIHRFLAGDEGHGGIEDQALQEAGFSEQEAQETYYGNWLRDFSQLLDKDSPDDPQTLETIRMLAIGEFGRAPGNADLGRYLPSEHVDRPEGGESAEDPVANPKESAQRRSDRLSALSPEQQAWAREERSPEFQAMIRQRSDASGLPDYVERGKEHAKREIAAAAAAGRNERGLQALGNGLHAVEDYFAHSNFVEVALAQLGVAGKIARDDPRLQATRHYQGVDPAHLGKPDEQGRVPIVTGTAAPGANDTVGLWEALKTEIGNHQFLGAMLKSAIRRPWQAFRTVGKLLLSKIGGLGGGLVGGLLGAVGGLFAGAGRGVAAGWSSGRHWWSRPFTAIAGLFGGAGKGLVSGARSGWELGGKAGAAAGRFLGTLVGPLVYPAAMLMGAIMEFAPVIGGGLRGIAHWRMGAATRKSVGENPTGPTHSQIAKDDPEHPLHATAVRLALYVDRDIGRMMIAVWAKRAPVSAAQDLVELYIAHPQDRTWWQPLLASPTGKVRSKE